MKALALIQEFLVPMRIALYREELHVTLQYQERLANKREPVTESECTSARPMALLYDVNRTGVPGRFRNLEIGRQPNATSTSGFTGGDTGS